MLLENKADRPFVQRVYRNLRVEGSVSNTVHANLRQDRACACAGRHRRILLYGPGDIQRRIQRPFGARSRDHQGWRPACQGSVRSIRPGHGEDLGVHLSTQDSARCDSLRRRTTCTATEIKGVLILAPNFADPQGGVNFAPATSISRRATPRSSPIDSGSAQSTVKGSLIIDTFVCLDQSIVPPLEDGRRARLSDRVLSAKEHSAMFSSNSRESRIDCSSRALGEAHATVKELVRDIQAVQPKAYRYTVQICTVHARNGSAVPGDGGLASFLVILKTVNPCLFEDLVERGPRERWSEKSLPADASDSEGQKRATGARRGGGRVTSVYPEPENHGRIASSSIMSLGVLIDRSNSTEGRASHAAHG
ncbi:hypothetical protein Q5P01_000821 [Channa striata]|uniref:Uncharacterized protein n=1 Tax=Channa striata TaxID=64152 RepID=A0AA88IH29_CHASR|nr:hypothetical protein Q5P01_000821 [Channa striata]